MENPLDELVYGVSSLKYHDERGRGILFQEALEFTKKALARLEQEMLSSKMQDRDGNLLSVLQAQAIEKQIKLLKSKKWKILKKGTRHKFPVLFKMEGKDRFEIEDGFGLRIFRGRRFVCDGYVKFDGTLILEPAH